MMMEVNWYKVTAKKTVTAKKVMNTFCGLWNKAERGMGKCGFPM